jgi:hypothetical protein
MSGQRYQIDVFLNSDTWRAMYQPHMKSYARAHYDERYAERMPEGLVELLTLGPIVDLAYQQFEPDTQAIKDYVERTLRARSPHIKILNERYKDKIQIDIQLP